MIVQRFNGLWANPDIINLNIKHVDFQKLEFQRQRALSGDKSFQYVDAGLSHNNEDLKIKIRLKGDRKIHFDSLASASYRIEIKKGETFLGMKKFSLHKPRARNYIHEWIFLKIMAGEGIISPRYEFVRLVVNGNNQGVYALEEHYTKHLLENNYSREGPIIRFDESTGYRYAKTTITPYEQNKWLSEEKLPVMQKAIRLLEGYRAGELPFSKAFDIKKWAVFFALADVTSSRHALVSKSLRIYYNPITSRLEPIPFDGHHRTGDFLKMHIAAELGIQSENNWVYETDADWFFNVFNNPETVDYEFISEYLDSLNRFSKGKYVDLFFNSIEHDLADNLSIINSELNFHDNNFSFGPIPFVFKKNHYFEKSEYIQSLLKPSVEAYIAGQTDNALSINIVNNHTSLPVEPVGIGCEQPDFMFEEDKLVFPDSLNTDKAVHKVSFFDGSVDDVDLTCLNVFVKLPGIIDVYDFNIRPWNKVNTQGLLADLLRQKSNIRHFDVFYRDKLNRLILKKGDYVFDETLIIDENLIVEAGANIQLVENASIVIRGSLNMNGLKASPIMLTSDGSGGLMVIGAKEPSLISHTVFENLNAPFESGTNITGAVTFYESNVIFNSTHFKNNYSEDALNVIQSKIRMNDVYFFDINQDALDVDFGELHISSAVFSRVGNDAIDISGSTAQLDDISIALVGDKAISVGEKSQLHGSNIMISAAETGVASKDNSIAYLQSISLLNVKNGFAAFKKKSEYGPGTIELTNVSFDHVDKPYLIEVGSKISFDQLVKQGDLNDVGGLLN